MNRLVVSVCIVVSLCSACTASGRTTLRFRGVPSATIADLAADLPVISSRLRAVGFLDPVVSLDGPIVVVKVQSGSDAVVQDLVTTRGVIEFRPVLSAREPGAPDFGTPCEPANPSPDPARAPASWCVGEPSVAPTQWVKFELGPAALSNDAILNAQAAGNKADPKGWLIAVHLTGAGARAFKHVTGELACQVPNTIRRQLAVTLDGLVLTHPQMGDAVGCTVGIGGGTASISRDFTETQAKELGAVINSGPLATPLFQD